MHRGAAVCGGKEARDLRVPRVALAERQFPFLVCILERWPSLSENKRNGRLLIPYYRKRDNS